jgi:hypothetical protein
MYAEAVDKDTYLELIDPKNENDFFIDIGIGVNSDTYQRHPLCKNGQINYLLLAEDDCYLACLNYRQVLDSLNEFNNSDIKEIMIDWLHILK